MQPPTDSLHHQNLKLAEFISNGQITQAPRPAYPTTTPTPPAPNNDQLAEYDDGDYDHPSAYPAPITINIDASLKIEGHANTIILPPSGSSPPTSLSSSPEQLSAQPRGGAQRPSPKGRAERFTRMALTALKDAGLLDPIPDIDGQMMRSPVDLHVNAGIFLKGSRNMVCTGLPKLMKSTAGGGAAKGEAEGKRHECAVTMTETRKRRACSVSALHSQVVSDVCQVSADTRSRSRRRCWWQRNLAALESLACCRHHCS